MIVHAAEIDLGILGGNAENRAVAHGLGVSGSRDQGLGGNGTSVEGITAQPGFLDEHHRCAVGTGRFRYCQPA